MSTAAQQLSEWLESTHPELFDVVYRHALKTRNSAVLAKARLRGFGQDISEEVSDILSDTAPIELDFSTIDIPTLNAADLQSVSLSPIESGALDFSTDQSGSGFLQTIGSGISSAASSVANFITSPQGINDLTQLGAAYFSLQNNKANAQLQSQVLQSQIARTTSGQTPSPIVYGSINGRLTPIYASNPLPITSSGGVMAPGTMPSTLVSAIASGQTQLVSLPDGTTGYVVPSNMISGLGGNISQQVLPWVLIIGGGLLLLHAIRY